MKKVTAKNILRDVREMLSKRGALVKNWHNMTEDRNGNWNSSTDYIDMIPGKNCRVCLLGGMVIKEYQMRGTRNDTFESLTPEESSVYWAARTALDKAHMKIMGSVTIYGDPCADYEKPMTRKQAMSILDLAIKKAPAKCLE